jgi:hypothetical protein
MAATLFSVLLLSACAGSSQDYPSLAIRDAERAFNNYPVCTETADGDCPDQAVGQEQDGEGEAYTPPRPGSEVIARAQALAGEVGDLHTRFRSALPGAQRAVSAARGQPVSSKAWGAAEVAVANLAGFRMRAGVPFADLDQLVAQTQLAGIVTADLEPVRDAARALIEEEDAALDSLRASLRR